MDKNRRRWSGKAKLRERIRRFAFTRRGKRRKLKNETRDRALKAYSLLTPRDLVIRHQWLFEKIWVDESNEEFEDENFDYQKREENIRKLRIGALKEIWTAQKFEGIVSLLNFSGAASAVGWHLADGVIKEQDAIALSSAIPRGRRPTILSKSTICFPVSAETGRGDPKPIVLVDYRQFAAGENHSSV